jgi:hypothetical protein
VRLPYSGTNTPVGTTLTAQASGYTLSYQWLRNGGPIYGATRSTYTLTGADYGLPISVKVTGPTGATATSNQVRPSRGSLKFTALPTISGTAKVGKKLTVKYAVGPTVSTVTKSFQWYRSGKKISKATKSTYKLTSKDRGKKITVKVTLKATGYLTISKTSGKTKAVKR